MTIKETLDKYEHMGIVLSDPEWAEGSFAHAIARDLWLALKAEQAEIEALTAQLAEARAEVAKLKEQNRVLATTSLRDVIKSVHPSGRARGQ